jgi:hypothetical protein
MNEQLPSFREVLGVMKQTAPLQIFEITADGSMTFHGYDVDEVVLLLESYRAHLAAMGELARSADAATWHPVGPEGV